MATNINRQPSLDEIRELLSSYLDGEVTEEERLWVEQAVADSADLRQELESLRQMVDLLAAMPPMAAPRPFTLSEADVQPVSFPAQKRSFWGFKWFGSLAMTAAALACVVIMGWVLFSTQLSQAPQEVAVSTQAENAPAAPTLAQAEAGQMAEQEAASVAREEANAAEAVVEEESAAAEADEGAEAEQPEIALAPPAEEEMAGEAAADQVEEEMAAAQAVEEAAEEEMTTTQAVEGAAQEAPPAEEEMAAAQAVEEAAEGQAAPAPAERVEITGTQDTTERMTAPAPEASPTPEVATFSQEATVLPPPQPEAAADAAAAEVAPSLKSAPEETEAAPGEEEPAQLLVEPEEAQEEATLDQAYSAEQATATLAPTATPQPSPTMAPAPATVAPTAGTGNQVSGEPESSTEMTTWLITGALLLILLVSGAIIWSKLGKR